MKLYRIETFYSSSDRSWFNNNSHREYDMPSDVYVNGVKFWCKNGAFHRIGAPAMIYSDGYKEYWINGKQIIK